MRPELCCQEHYGWKLNACINSSSGSSGSSSSSSAASTLYYPDWSASVCKNDGGMPEYMALDPTTHMHATLEACCKEYFQWNLDGCTSDSSESSESSSIATLFYPDWSTESCKNDGLQPNYMSEAPGTWMYETLDACCDEKFWWETCSGATGYYADYQNGSCAYGVGGRWKEVYPTLELCCENKFWWDEECSKGGAESEA